MLSNRIIRIVVVVVVASLTFLIVRFTILQNSTDKEKNREVLESILSSGQDQPGTISRNDPFFDGGEATITEGQFTGTVAQVQALLDQRLGAEGFELTCPGNSSSVNGAPPAGQENGAEPKQICNISGHGVQGTAWMSTNVDYVNVSSVIRF